MAQVHSYYITNAKSELKFCNTLSEDELESTIQEITTAMINNDDLFDEDEEEEDIFSDSESINLDGEDTDNLLIANIMDLDISEFEDSGDSGEKNEENDMSSDSIQLDPNNEDVNNVNFEAILAEEFD